MSDRALHGPADPRSILVFITSDPDDALGENVLKLPLLLALKSAFPLARIAWVPGTSGAFYLRGSLAPLVGGRIDEFITDLAIPKDPRASLRMKHPILGRHFDLIVDTQRYLGRTLFLKRIPHRRFISGTWRYVWSDARPPRPLLLRPPLLVDKLVGLAAAAAGHPIAVPNPIPLPPKLRARAAELLPAGPSYVGLAPGAGNKAKGKCWPLDGFIAVARAQVERGRVPVFLLGPEEGDWHGPLRGGAAGAVSRATQPQRRAGRDRRTLPRRRARRAAVGCRGELLGNRASSWPPAGRRWCRSMARPARKYAPFARARVCLKAQDYGSDRIGAIPLDAVLAAVERQAAMGPAAGIIPTRDKRGKCAY